VRVNLRASPGTALLLDAAGTVLQPREPVARTYARFATAHGARCNPSSVERALAHGMEAFRGLRALSRDWRPYWAAVIRHSTGCDAPGLLEDLYDHFARGDAWVVAEGAADCCRAVRQRGMKTAIVLNWDVRLRAILDQLEVWSWIDLAVISAEEGVEKPSAAIFHRTCDRLGVAPDRAVHVGDSRRNDVEGARAAGLHAWHFGTDVPTFHALRARLLAPAT